MQNPFFNTRMDETERYRFERRLLRIGLVVGLLGFCVSVGFGPRVEVLIGLIGGLLALILLQKPELGFLILPALSLVVPFELSTGTQTTLNATILIIPLLLAVLLVRMFLDRDFRLARSSLNAPVVVFVICATLSLLAGNLIWNVFADLASIPSQTGGWAIFAFSALLLLAVGNLVREQKWLEWITWLYLGLGGSYVLLSLASIPIPSLFTAINAIFPNGATGSLFWLWMVAMAGGQALFNTRAGPGTRLVMAGVATATIVLGFGFRRDWESGWVPAIVALGVLVWLRSWRWGAILTAAALMAVLVLAPGIVAERLRAEDYSISTRVVAAEVLLTEVVKANPILGLGPANYYFYTPLFSLLGYYVQFNSHNQYIDIVAQLGLVGLAAFSWLSAALGLVGWRLRKRVREGFARAYVNGCLAGLAAMLFAGLLGDWFLPFVYNIGIRGFRTSVMGWLFLGGLITLEQLAPGRRSVAAETREGERLST